MEKENEIWKPVVGYEGLYEVSNLGNVRSIDRVIEYSNGVKHFTKGKKLKQSINKNTGYYQVSLCNNGNAHKIDVHKIVANTFLSNDKSLPCVNHKDESRTNNNVSNLEFCSYKYNSNYGTAIQRMKNSIRLNANRVKKVSQYDLNGDKIKTYETISDVTKDGFLPCCVQSCCNPNTNEFTHKKFIWVYDINENHLPEILEMVSNRARKSKNTPINMFDINGNFIGLYKSAAEIERIYKIDHTSISRCCRGLQKSSSNYTFKYAE